MVVRCTDVKPSACFRFSGLVEILAQLNLANGYTVRGSRLDTVPVSSIAKLSKL